MAKFKKGDYSSAHFDVEILAATLFDRYDFHAAEFAIEEVVSPVEPPPEPLPKIPLNEYKRFKAISNGETYYMSGKNKWR